MKRLRTILCIVWIVGTVVYYLFVAILPRIGAV